MKLPKEIREKQDLKTAGTKPKKCSVDGCGKEAIRSLSENAWTKYIEKAKLKVNENKYHKVFLCKEHYKEINKIRKSDEKLIQKKGFLDDSRASKKGKYTDDI